MPKKEKITSATEVVTPVREERDSIDELSRKTLDDLEARMEGVAQGAKKIGTEFVATVTAKGSEPDPELAQFILEMQAAIAHIEHTERQFWKKVWEVVTFKGSRDRKTTEQLNKPDNPVVINDLVQRLVHLNGQVISRANAIKKRVQPPGELGRFDAAEAEATIAPRAVEELLSVADLYGRARKEDEKKWERVRSSVGNKLRTALSGALRAGDAALVSEIWRAHPKEDLAEDGLHIFNALVYDFESPQKTGEFTPAAFLKKQADLRRYCESKAAELAAIPELAELFNDMKADQLEYRVFTHKEQFLLKQDSAAVGGLLALPDAVAGGVASAWFNYSYDKDAFDFWRELLVDERLRAHAATLLDMTEQVKFYDMQPAVVRHVMLDFTPEQLAMGWSKIKPVADRLSIRLWENAYGYLALATLDHITDTDLTRVSDYYCLPRISEVAVAYGVPALQTSLTRANFEYELQDRGGLMAERQPVYSLSPGLLRFFRRGAERVTKEETLEEQRRRIQNFIDFLKVIPPHLHENFFSTFEPSDDIPGAGVAKLGEDTVNNFLEFRTTDARSLTLREFFEIDHYFAPELYQRVVRGRSVLGEKQFTAENAPLRTYLKACECAGAAQQAASVELYVGFAKREDSLVRTNARGAHLEKRTDKDVELIFSFVPTIERIGAKNFEVGLEFVAAIAGVEFSEYDRTILRELHSGTLTTKLRDFADAALVEGCIIRIATQLAQSMTQRQEIERFAAYSEAQQKLLVEVLALSRIEGYWWTAPKDQFFADVESGTAARAVEFARAHPETREYRYDAVRQMALRADCVGLFYYILPKPTALDAGNELSVIERLIALKDAGLPESMFLPVPDAESRLLRFGNSDRHFAQRDMAKFLFVAKELAGSPFKLPDFEWFDEDLTEEQLKTRARVSRLLGTCLPLGHGEYKEVTLQQEAAGSERIAKAEQQCGRALIPYERHAVFNCSDKGWGRLAANNELLQLFLERHQTLPEHVWDLPDSLLTDARLWKYCSPEMLVSAELAQTHLQIIERCTAAGIELDSQRYREKNVPVELFYRAPWLFEEENLREVGIDGIRYLADISREQLAAIRPSLQLIEYSSFEVGKVAHFVLESDPQAIAALHEFAQLVNAKIPWDVLTDIGPELGKSEAKDLIGKLDSAQEPENGEPLMRYFARREWRAARLVGLSLAGGSAGASAKDLEGEAFVAALQRLTHCTPTGLANLERITQMGPFHRLDVYKNEVVFTAINHRNIPLFFDFISATSKRGWFGDSDDFFGPSAHIIEMLDQLTAEKIAQIRTFPEYITVRKKDLLGILREPRCAEIMSLAERLYKIYDGKVSPFVDTLFLMTPQDVSIVEDLARRCCGPMTIETMSGLACIAEGEEKRALEKVMAMWGSDQKIDIISSFELLKNLQPDLRRQVFTSQAPRFGWDLAAQRDAAARDLDLDRKVIWEAIINLYQTSGPSFERIDFAVAQELWQYDLKNGSKDRLTVLAQRLFTTLVEDKILLLELANSAPEAFCAAAGNYNYSQSVPVELKTSADFWDLMLAWQPEKVMREFNALPAGYWSAERQQAAVDALQTKTPADIMSLIDLHARRSTQLTDLQMQTLVDSYLDARGTSNELINLHVKGTALLAPRQLAKAIDSHIENNWSLYFLNANQGEDLQKKELFEARIDEIFTLWHTDPPRLIRLIEIVSNGNFLDSKYLDKVVDIFLDSRMQDALLQEKLVKIIARLTSASGRDTQQDKMLSVLERGVQLRVAWATLAQLPVDNWDARHAQLSARTEGMELEYPGARVVQRALVKSLKSRAAFETDRKHLAELEQNVRRATQAADEVEQGKRARTVEVIVGAQQQIGNKNLRNRLQKAFFDLPVFLSPAEAESIPDRLQALAALLHNHNQMSTEQFARLGNAMYKGNVTKRQKDQDALAYFFLDFRNTDHRAEFLGGMMSVAEAGEREPKVKQSLFDITQIMRACQAIDAAEGVKMMARANECFALIAQRPKPVPETKKREKARRKKAEESAIEEAQQKGEPEVDYNNPLNKARWLDQQAQLVLSGLIGGTNGERGLLVEFSERLITLFNEKSGVALTKNETLNFLDKFADPNLVFVYLGKLQDYPKQKKLFQEYITAVARNELAAARYSLNREHLDTVFAGRSDDEETWKKNISLRELAGQEGSPAEALRQRVGDIVSGALSDRHMPAPLHARVEEFFNANPEGKRKVVARTRVELSDLNIVVKLAAEETDAGVTKMKEGIRKSLTASQMEDVQLVERAFNAPGMPPLEESLKTVDAALKLMLLLEARAEDFVSGQIESPKEGSEKRRKPLVIRELITTLKTTFPPETVFGNDIVGMDKEIAGLKEKMSATPDLGGVLTAQESEDPDLLLRLGTDVESSCQNVNGTPSLNRNLVSYIMDGKCKVLFVRDSEGAIVGRSIMRLLYDEEDKQPVIHLERSYHRSGSPVETVNNMLLSVAVAKAKALGYPLVVSGRFSAREELTTYPHSIKSYGGPGDMEYVDNIGGGQPNQKYTISASQISLVKMAA